ncbi:hypothetical protein [Paenibacillus alkalitolerans]|uniref:hypothetical protein n=1 Tax=Paenibacillus alkalitolerans TaxID=2799335 RepID=UPI0018F64147|nr:hypothetical protein [Paenibacillus alkalitolerans]
MLKKILKKLLYSSLSSKRHYKYGRKYSSSDHHYKPHYGHPPKHNQYGHGYYKKKGYSSYSSS